MNVVHGYKILKEWEISNTGYTALAEKDGKKYFLKKYSGYKFPRSKGSATDKAYERARKRFNDFKTSRENINDKLKEISGSGGNIVSPMNSFVEDLCFVEVTEFYDNVFDESRIYLLNDDEKKFLMLTTAASLETIHGKGIVHSDLKRSNIIVVRSGSGKRIVAKIIDFDKSYDISNIRPDDLGGDQCYMSPELVNCLINDYSDESIKDLSDKSDIFSLGLVFYNYLTGGKFPDIIDESGKLVKSGTTYCGEAVLRGMRLRIGTAIKNECLRSVIANMLYSDPKKRISAREVRLALRDGTVLEVKEDSGIKYVGEKKTKVGRSREIAVPESFCEPWEEDGIVFKIEELKKNHYVAAERKEEGTGRRYYELYDDKGGVKKMFRNNLLLSGFAKSSYTASGSVKKIEKDDARKYKIVKSVKFRGNEYTVNDTLLEKDGYKGVVRTIADGKEQYALKSKDNSLRNMSVNNIILYGYLNKK